MRYYGDFTSVSACLLPACIQSSLDVRKEYAHNIWRQALALAPIVLPSSFAVLYIY